MTTTKILLAEDDLFLRDIYKETLSDAGFSVTIATTGNETRAKFQQGGWDLVLLDDIMPGSTGVEVLQRFKQEERHTLAKKIIFLTNIDEPSELKKFDSLSDGHLVKNELTPAELIEKIKEFLTL